MGWYREGEWGMGGERRRGGRWREVREGVAAFEGAEAMTEFGVNNGLNVCGTSEEEGLEVEPEVGETLRECGGKCFRDASKEGSKVRTGCRGRARGGPPGAEVGHGIYFVRISGGVGACGTIMFGVEALNKTEVGLDSRVNRAGEETSVDQVKCVTGSAVVGGVGARIGHKACSVSKGVVTRGRVMVKRSGNRGEGRVFARVCGRTQGGMEEEGGRDVGRG